MPVYTYIIPQFKALSVKLMLYALKWHICSIKLNDSKKITRMLKNKV